MGVYLKKKNFLFMTDPVMSYSPKNSEIPILVQKSVINDVILKPQPRVLSKEL